MSIHSTSERIYYSRSVIAVWDYTITRFLLFGTIQLLLGSRFSVLGERTNIQFSFGYSCLGLYNYFSVLTVWYYTITSRSILRGLDWFTHHFQQCLNGKLKDILLFW